MQMSETSKAPTVGLQLESYQVVYRPLVTEKGVHRATRHNAYAFEVHPQATKTDIKRAIEELFNVRVMGVRTQNRLGKSRRYRHRQGVTSGWKKAIVKLAPDSRIDFY